MYVEGASTAHSAGLCAAVAGFNLHAGVAIDDGDYSRLERLCRYVARPPLATERLRERPDGRFALDFKRAWRDGTAGIVLDPLDLMARLAALVPPPRVNLVRYHGVFAPAARLRGRIIGQPPLRVAQVRGLKRPRRTGPPTRRVLLWAELMRRVFGLEVLTCPRCGGRARVIALIDDAETIRTILDHLGHPSQPPRPDPPRPPPDPYVAVA